MPRKKPSDDAPLLENHQAEQYFFTEGTVKAIGDFLTTFEHPCCLCAPMVGRYLAGIGHPVTTLDQDQRFSSLPGFQTYDLYRPQWIDRKFDVIFCDPPFFNVSLSQLFKALRQLSHNDFSQKIVLCYLSRRTDAVVGSFHLYNLQPTGKLPQYRTVQQIERNQIELFANLDLAQLSLPTSSGSQGISMPQGAE